MGFAAVEIASDLRLDTSPGSNSVKNVVEAIGYLVGSPPSAGPAPVEWAAYFKHTTDLWRDVGFMRLG